MNLTKTLSIFAIKLYGDINQYKRKQLNFSTNKNLKHHCDDFFKNRKYIKIEINQIRMSILR